MLLQMPRRFCHSCRASLHATDKHWWVCFMLGHRPCWKSAHWDVMSPLRWYVPLLYALAARFIFREQPRALLLFSSQGPARKSHRGRGFQRPEKSELSPAVKIFSRSLHPHWPAFLCGCERSGLVRGEQWRRVGRQPVIGGFRYWGAGGLI